MERQEITAKIEEIVSSFGFQLIDFNIRGDHHLPVLEIYIDGEKGITTVDCSNVSRHLDEIFQKENLIGKNYRLDVSSPGVDRPLKFLVQYGKHINRKFDLEYSDGEETKKLIAKLVRVEGDQLYFQEKNSDLPDGQARLKISFQNIIKAKVLISF